MNGWEYHQEHLDFHTLTVPRSCLRGNIAIRGSQDIVPISNIKFYYRNFRDSSNQSKVRYQAWQLISPVIQQRVNELGAQGWELTTSFSPTLVHTTEAGRFPEGLLLLICIIFFPLAFVLLIYMYIFGSDYFVYISADLPLRRHSS